MRAGETARPIGTIEVSLDSSWPKDSPRMEASGFPEPVGPEIGKNEKTFLICTSSVHKV